MKCDTIFFFTTTTTTTTYGEMQTSSLVRQDGLISALVTASSSCAEMTPYLLPNDAVCIYSSSKDGGGGNIMVYGELFI